ncbi:MAG: D-hexose-6-phosphate mutarotase [Alphaproteobacteria bacterium]|nr:D-hexose-6-phosphate mutarotase [Alphaproteobacteria bacterium]
MQQSIDDLKRILPADVSVGGDQLSGPILEVDRGGCRAQISIFGAHIVTWQPPGHDPVLWLSEGAYFDQKHSIRAGIPVCWPWFADHPDHPDWPAHGVARTTPWKLEATSESDEGLAFRFCLPATPAHQPPHQPPHQPHWPHASRPVVDYVIGDELHVTLSNTNTDRHPLDIGQALHTYFNVGNIADVTIQGLETSPFIDKLAQASSDRNRSPEYRPIVIASETDRIYRSLSGPVELHDASLGRIITIDHQGATNAVVWNPWTDHTARLDDMGSPDAFRGMVCIETGNVPPDALRLAPGATHTLHTRLTVQKT